MRSSFIRTAADISQVPPGSPPLVAKLVASSGLRLLLFEYRLAPEHPFPAALEDTLITYRWMLTQIAPSTRIIIAGKSAGGGLCLATLLALKDLVAQGESGLKLPVAGVSISPSTDMKLNGKPNLVKGSIEPEGMAFYCSKYYVGGQDPCHPYISPLYGDFHHMPHLLLTVGGDENALDNSVRFAERAQAAGVEARLIIGPGQVHCYPLLPDFIPESKYAMGGDPGLHPHARLNFKRGPGRRPAIYRDSSILLMAMVRTWRKSYEQIDFPIESEEKICILK